MTCEGIWSVSSAVVASIQRTIGTIGMSAQCPRGRHDCRDKQAV